MLELVEYIKKNKLGDVYCNKLFKQLTTIKVGGKIQLLFYPKSIESFIIFYRKYIEAKKYPLVILGNGSNILASSSEYKGIVVCFKKIIFKYCLFNNQILVNSGVLITDLINYLKKYNLGGLEQLAYIPATIGGMIKMNAGAYGKTISEHLNYVKCINEFGEVKVYQKKDLYFGYRKCNINEIILECCFELNYESKEKIAFVMNQIQEDRKMKHPVESYNAGSTFKNGDNYIAWKLIDSLNFRGFNVNDAQVSSKHCNFIINKKNAKSEDIIVLIYIIKKVIYNKYKIKLECEWNFINFKKSISFL